MKIYTKTGDDGTTGLFGGGRVPKNSPRIEAYGTVDELNSVIGILAAQQGSAYFLTMLQDFQRTLFVLGSDLATPLESKTTYSIPRIEESDVKKLESLIDSEELHLPPLERFILPGGSAIAGYFHQARTVCRRAEREVITLSQSEKLGEFDIQYLNRLSDLFFVLARRANQLGGITDVEWDGKKS
jgi:cob(I)alamin adenosyltransferase